MFYGEDEKFTIFSWMNWLSIECEVSAFGPLGVLLDALCKALKIRWSVDSG